MNKAGNLLTASAATFVVTWVLLLGAPEHAWLFNLLLALFMALLAAMWVLGSANVKRHRLGEDGGWIQGPDNLHNTDIPPKVFENFRYRLWKDERVLRSTRRHRVELFVAAPFLLFGLVAFAGCLYLLVFYPVFHFSTASFMFGSTHRVTAKHFGVPVWWLPLLVSLPCLYVALVIWQEWKWSLLIITNERFIDAREQSDYLFWIGGRKFNPTPVDQVKDIDDQTGTMGSVLGWGSVVIKRFPSVTADETQTFTFKRVPHESDFARDLRLVSPAVAPRVRNLRP